MSMRDTDTRTVTLVDIPLVRRLVDKPTMLDCELTLTRDYHGSQSALSSLLLPQRGLYTLIARADKQQVVGQFRLKADDPHAHIVYLAPSLIPDSEDTAWLHVLDAMAREAGKNGAHALLAEVDEATPLFETMRTAGYAVYARQEIWRYEPQGAIPKYHPHMPLTEATEADMIGIFALFAATVPGMVQQFTLPAADMQRLVYRVDDRIEAYIAYSEGKNGIYIIPYLHPDILQDAPALFESALRQIPKASKVPVYVCVRRYQDWLGEVLDEIGFTPHLQQAVMVKHITAGVRHASFAPLLKSLEHATQPAKPPVNRCYHEAQPEHLLDAYPDDERLCCK